MENETVRARSQVSMSPETAQRIGANEVAKGDVLAAARYAGIRATRSADTFPSPEDPGTVGEVTVDFLVGDDAVDVLVAVVGTPISAARLHALTATTTAALTIYDMCKSVDRTMAIGPVALVD